MLHVSSIHCQYNPFSTLFIEIDRDDNSLMSLSWHAGFIVLAQKHMETESGC